MKKTCTIILAVLCLAQLQLLNTSIIQTQRSSEVQCGSTVEGRISSSESIDYSISVSTGETLIIHVEPIGSYSNMDLDLYLFDPGGSELERDTRNSYSADFRSAELPSSGTYTIRVRNASSSRDGTYQLYVDCISVDGNVISGSRFTQSAQCGLIANHEFPLSESHRYLISLQRGDTVDLRAEPTGSYSNMDLDLYLFGPRGNELERDTRNSTTASIITGELPDSGLYTIVVRNASSSRSGTYIFYIGCVQNGQVVQPGDAPPVDLTSPAAESPSTSLSQPVFSGFGFPGVTAVDFSSGIEIPLQAGQIQTVPLASDVALYTYATSAGEVATLSVTRASGDISIGVAVINQGTNEIIFLGGMPSSNNLSVELTFPTSGTYAIGLFRLDTAERSGTSGAVQLVIE